MKIEQALNIKKGDIVSYPEDRGDKAGKGTVMSVSSSINKNIHGTEYIWVGLKGGGVWPSNRLNNH